VWFESDERWREPGKSGHVVVTIHPERTQVASPATAPDQRPSVEHLASRLRQVGQRVTSQRLLILGAFQPDEHLAADEVLRRVEGQLPAVNRSTVYRALELFRDLGLVSETDLGGGVRQFELIAERRHHHLICHHCGVITDFDDSIVAPLRRALRDRNGFTATIDHLAIFGWCAACAVAQIQPDAAPPPSSETTHDRSRS